MATEMCQEDQVNHYFFSEVQYLVGKDLRMLESKKCLDFFFFIRFLKDH